MAMKRHCFYYRRGERFCRVMKSLPSVGLLICYFVVALCCLHRLALAFTGMLRRAFEVLPFVRQSNLAPSSKERLRSGRGATVPLHAVAPPPNFFQRWRDAASATAGGLGDSAAVTKSLVSLGLSSHVSSRPRFARLARTSLLHS
uniref:Uncharacterized protein n=1 Tax=Odontella aurita TaxID=265563 RepID=A0A7S4MCR1_9STRA